MSDAAVLLSAMVGVEPRDLTTSGSEPVLVGTAHGFEQATCFRREPQFLPAL